VARRIGLVGIGHIGTRVAALGTAFGLEVIATDPLLSAEEIARRGAEAVSFDELLAQIRLRVAALPARCKSTLKLMNAGTFARMKKGAIFITTARGGIHDEAALVHALRSGHLAGAGLDVWDQEPPPLDHPLLAMDNVFATFHVAGVTHESRRNVAAIACRADRRAAGRRAAAAPHQPRSLARLREAARADPALKTPSPSSQPNPDPRRRHLNATHHRNCCAGCCRPWCCPPSPPPPAWRQRRIPTNRSR
jgi:phosphoglycerate dehydrogenase-like enzyme